VNQEILDVLVKWYEYLLKSHNINFIVFLFNFNWLLTCNVLVVRVYEGVLVFQDYQVKKAGRYVWEISRYCFYLNNKSISYFIIFLLLQGGRGVRGPTGGNGVKGEQVEYCAIIFIISLPFYWWKFPLDFALLWKSKS
jgi:hypothetical protein